ncbi:MAG: hypothetical protein NVS4B6_20010 [Mycobacterium sp.]
MSLGIRKHVEHRIDRGRDHPFHSKLFVVAHPSTLPKLGHDGNLALRELADSSVGSSEGAGIKTDHARHFVFSILRVFGPSTSSSEVDAAESHYKRTLMTREFGLNRN